LQERASTMAQRSGELLAALKSWQGEQASRDDMTWFGFRW